MRKGFSLIELVIVLGILVVLATFAVVFLGGFTGQRNLVSTGQSMASLLRDAQERSINQEQGKYWGVRFENLTLAKRYIIFNATSTPYSTIATTTIMFLKSPLVFLQPSVGNSTDVVFDKISGLIINNSACISDSVNSSTTIQIAIGNNNNVSSSIRIYCNGRIEF